jgi:hypothetical protein
MSTDTPRLSPIVCLLAALFFAAYLGFVAWYTSPHAGGGDSSGYLNSAKLLTEGKIDTELRVPSWAQGASPKHLFMPLGFVAEPHEQRIAPSYPVGQPMHLALAASFVGFTWATMTINLVGTAACFSLLYLTARQFKIRPAWALAVVILYALSPLVFSYTLQSMSELTATTWVLASIYCAIRSRDKSPWAVGAGFAFSIAVLVRPTNLLAIVPLLIGMGLSWRRLLGLSLGGIPGALFLAWYNHTLYGSPFTTGYGHVSGSFAIRYLWPTVQHYAIWIPVLFTPLVIAALGLPFTRIMRLHAWILATWAGSFLMLYATYDCTHDVWWTLRFILPALPAIVISAALVLQHIDRPCCTFALTRGEPGNSPTQWRRVTISILALTLPLAIAWQWTWGRHFKVEDLESGERIYKEMAEWAQKNLPTDALFACGQFSGSMYFYTDKPCLYFPFLDNSSYATLTRLAATNNITLYAGLVDHEEADAFKAMPGRWERVAKIRQGYVWKRTSTP